MTKSELYDTLREHGYTDPEFFTDLDEDTTGTVDRIISMIENGKSEEAWQEIENLYDEYTFFSVFDDDIDIITLFMTNEAYIP